MPDVGAIIDHARAALGAEACAIWGVDEVGALVRVHGDGVADDGAARRTADGETPVFCDDTGEGLLPLVADGRVIGVLAVRLRRPLTPADRAGLVTFGRIAAGALAADAAAAEREALLAMMSHDLRNPLGSISTIAELLRTLKVDDPAAARVRRYADIIDRATSRMSRWLSDLVDLARLEVGRLPIALAPHDPAAIVGDAVDQLAPAAVDKGVSLAGEPRLVRPVVCDRDRILHVLGHLVGNAIKFTPAGGAVRVEVAAADQVARFTVTDTGPGIADAQREALFERSWRSRRSRSGNGVGLALSRSLVEAHGGKIWVDSEPGHGAAFHFTVPSPA
jgi:signal transduction histidine kinase